MTKPDIDTLVNNPTVLQFPQVYALEWIHGTTASLDWNGRSLLLDSGGCKSKDFEKLFDRKALEDRMKEVFGGGNAEIYGQAFGGKVKKMEEVYGKELRFFVTDINQDGEWMTVPEAMAACIGLGLSFVKTSVCSSKMEALTKEAEGISEAALSAGIHDKMRKGILIRPPIECVDEKLKRVAAKLKNPALHYKDEDGEVKKITPEALVIPAAPATETTGAILEPYQLAEKLITDELVLEYADKTTGWEMALSKTTELIKALQQNLDNLCVVNGIDPALLTTEHKLAIGRKAARTYRRISLFFH